ncbi:unnamed protein product, partial [Polarella glacialis]
AGTAKLYWVSNGNQLVHRHNLDGSGTSESVTSCGKAYYVSVWALAEKTQHEAGASYSVLLVNIDDRAVGNFYYNLNHHVSNISSNSTMFTTVTTSTSAVSAALPPLGSAAGGYASTTSFDAAASTSTSAPAAQAGGAAPASSGRSSTSGPPGPLAKKALLVGPTEPESKNEERVNFTQIFLLGILGSLLVLALAYVLRRWLRRRHAKVQAEETGRVQQDPTKRVQEEDDEEGLRLSSRPENQNSGAKLALDLQENLVPGGGVGSNDWKSVLSSPRTSFPRKKTEAGSLHFLEPESPKSEDAMDNMVSQAGDELLHDFEELFESSKAQTGKDLRPELGSILDGWRKRQLASTGGVDDITASLISGMAESAQDVVLRHAGAGSNFSQLKPHIEDGWRQRMATERLVHKAGDELLHDLEQLFESSKAQTGKDLRPELGSILDGWRKRQLASTGGVDDITASLISGMAESAQDVVLRHAGAGSNFSQLKPHIEAQTGKGLRPELGSILDGWRKRQLASTGGVDDITASLISGMAESAQDVVLRHASAGSNFSQLKPHIEDGWRQRMATERLVHKAGDELLYDFEELFESSKAQTGKDLRPELGSILDGWRKRQLASTGGVDDITASLISSMGESAQDVVLRHAGAGSNFSQLKPHIEDGWRQRMATDSLVHKAGDELLHDFEELFESSKAQTGKGLRPELGSILDSWRKRQLASTGGVDDITASLISGMAESAQDVVLRHAGAGSNFSQLKPHIEDGWRQRMATDRLVHKAGDELLHDLEKLCESSKAQTGKGLRPELGSILDGWRKRQLASTGGVDDITASLISGMAESAQDVVLRHASAGSNFSQLKPHIEDGWRQRMATERLVHKAGDELLYDFEELFESSKAQTGKDLRPELGSILDGWRKRQLASTGGVDDITASLISGMAESAQDVVLSHAGAGSNFSQLKPRIEDSWRQRMATERLVHKAGDELLHDFEELFESSKAQTGKDLRPELGSILDGWRKRQLASTGGVDDITASLISGMAESAQDVVLRHASAGSKFRQLKPHIEDGWRQRMATDRLVHKAGDELLHDLEELFESSKAQTGKDLRPELGSIVDGWRKRQLASTGGVDDITPSLISGMAESAQDVVLRHAGAGSNFSQLKPHIEDGWRQRMANISAVSRTAGASMRLPMQSKSTAEVRKAGDELLHDLAELFDASWARPGEDLLPDMRSLLDGWQKRQLPSGEDVDSVTASLIRSLAETAQDVVLRQAGSGDGTVPGGGNFRQLRPQIEEVWRQRTAKNEEADGGHARDNARRPPVPAKTSEEVRKAGDELLHDLAELFDASWARPGEDLLPDMRSLLDGWQKRQLPSGEDVDSVTASLIRSLAETAQDVVLRQAGSGDGTVPGGGNFRQLRPQIEEVWRQRTAKNEEADGGHEKLSKRTGKQVQEAGDQLMKDLEAFFDASCARPGEDLRPELESFFDGWHKRQLASGEDLDSNTASLIRGLAETAQDVPW